jgi:hypothetical protein
MKVWWFLNWWYVLWNFGFWLLHYRCHCAYRLSIFLEVLWKLYMRNSMFRFFWHFDFLAWKIVTYFFELCLYGVQSWFELRKCFMFLCLRNRGSFSVLLKIINSRGWETISESVKKGWPWNFRVHNRRPKSIELRFSFQMVLPLKLSCFPFGIMSRVIH